MTVEVGEPRGGCRRLAVPLFEEDVARARPGALKGLEKLAPGLAGVVKRAVDERAFKAKEGEYLLLVLPASMKVRAAVLLGLGPEKKEGVDSLRRAAGVLARRQAREAEGAVGLWLGGGRLRARLEAQGCERAGQAVAEGWGIGSYVYDVYKSGRRRRRRPCTLGLLPDGLGAAREKGLRAGVARGLAIAEAVSFARDLSNAPANEIYPETLALRARAMARARDLTVRILEQRELKRLGMGGILGVGQGSDRPPRLIVVRYRPRRRPRKIVVLVGKSITFDSGGLSIKPAKGMEEMKYDMSGGAAVLGALQAFSRLKPPVEVIGILPASENVIGGSALRPGDILRSASGKTIEIINTDAEGRLVLADALHYAQRFKPDFLIDLATLTGACLVALGTQVSGMVTNDKELSRKVFEAGERAGERVWELPLYDEFIEATKSQIADLKNSAGRNAGAITAAAFLSHFVGKTKWCHLDIAGTAWSDRESGHLAPGATGMGVRLMVEFVTALG